MRMVVGRHAAESTLFVGGRKKGLRGIPADAELRGLTADAAENAENCANPV